MSKRLTDASINSLPNPAARREIPAGITGLYLVVQPSGVKSWAVRYRFNGKPIKMVLGRYPMMTLADANAAAVATLRDVALGNNPAADALMAKAIKGEIETDRRNKMDTLVAEYHRRALSKLKSGNQALDFLTRLALQPWEAKGIKHGGWADSDIQSIHKRDVRELVEKISDSGRDVSANRVLAHLSAFFNWAVRRDVIEANPASNVARAVKEVGRERFLSEEEIKLFWQACDRVGQPFGVLFKVMLLTGQRRSEVAGMTDAELDGAMWTLDGSRTKNGRAHTVPLSGPVTDLLNSVVRYPSSPFIFTTTGKTPVSGFSKSFATLCAAMLELGQRSSPPIDIAPWRLHDLRRTCATGLASLRVPVRVTEAALNHVSGTGGGIVALYQKHDFADERREALDAWAACVMDLVA